MLNKIVQKILSEIEKSKPLPENKDTNNDKDNFLWEDVRGEDSIDTDAFTPKPAEPKISTYKLPAPKVPLAPPEPPIPPTPPEPPEEPVGPKVKVELPEIIIPKEKVEDPVYTASLVNTYSGGKMKLQVQNADGTYSDWAGNEDGSNDYNEYDMILGFFSGTMKIVDSETGEEIDLNKIRDMFNGTIKPEKPKTESSDPDLTASNLDAYTGGKMKLYIKQGSNYIEWQPNADGTNDFTEEEMIQMLFSGEAKMNYTETGEEVKLNTIKDLFNGTLKPENIKPDGVDVSKPADPVNPSKPESFTDIYNEMLEKVPSSTSTIEEKELALGYIQRILASDASQELKDYWTNKQLIINNEIKAIKSIESGKPESLDTVWKEMTENVPDSTSTIDEKELALSYIGRILSSDASQEVKEYWHNKAMVINNEMLALESIEYGKPESLDKVWKEMTENVPDSTSTLDEKELAMSYIGRILASDAAQDVKEYWHNKAMVINNEMLAIQSRESGKPEAFIPIYNEMMEKVPGSTSTIEEKELALSYIQRILASDASQKLKDYWTDKAKTIMDEIKGIQALNKPETPTKPTEPNKEVPETPTNPVTPTTPSGIRTQTNSGKNTDYYVIADGRRYYFESKMDCLMAKFSTVDEIKKKAVSSESMELKGGNNIKSNDDAVEIDSGEKSEFYMDIDNIRYYYKSSMDLMKAATSLNPSDNTSGKGRIMTQWGSQTEFYIDMDGSRYFFNSKTEKEAALQQLEEDKGVFGMLKFNKLVVGRS